MVFSPKNSELKFARMKPALIVLALLLVISLLVTAGPAAAQPEEELDEEGIEITVEIGHMVDIEIEDEELIVDLEEMASEEDALAQQDDTGAVEFEAGANFPFTMEIETSEHGLGEEDDTVLNDYFEYVLQEDTEEGDEWDFLPGEELSEGDAEFDPGVQEFVLELRLDEEVSEQLLEVIEADEDVDLAELGDEWTELAAGDYDDELTITFWINE